MVGMHRFHVQGPIASPKINVQTQYDYHRNNWNVHNDNIRIQEVELIPELLKIGKTSVVNELFVQSNIIGLFVMSII